MSYRKHHIKNKVGKLRPKKHFYKMPIFWYCTLSLLIVCVILYLFLFLPYVQIKNINITGNQEVKVESINNVVDKLVNKELFSIAKWHVNSKSIFIVNSGKVETNIKNSFGKVKTVKVEKKFFNTLNIAISERKPFAVFCENTVGPECYFIDNDGIIFKSYGATFAGFFKIIKNSNGENYFEGKEAVIKSVIDYIAKIEKLLENNYKINIDEFVIDKNLSLTAKTSEGWQVNFNLSEDMDLEISKLNTLLSSEISQTRRKSLQYINLMFKDRAYYK